MKRKITALLAALTAGVVMAGCASSTSPTTQASSGTVEQTSQSSNSGESASPSTESTSPAPSGALASIKAAGVIRVGVADDPPFIIQGSDGSWSSFCADLVRAMGEDLGVKVEFVPDGWTTIVAGLQSNHFDMIGASISATPARKEAVDFTEPYAESGAAYLVSSDNPKNLNSMDDLNDSSVTISVDANGFISQTTHKLLPKANIRDLTNTNIPVLVTEVSAGHADVAGVPTYLVSALKAKYSWAKILPDDTGVNPTGIGWAVNKGETDLLNYLDSFMEKAKSSGLIDKLYKEYIKVPQS